MKIETAIGNLEKITDVCSFEMKVRSEEELEEECEGIAYSGPGIYLIKAEEKYVSITEIFPPTPGGYRIRITGYYRLIK